MKNRKITQEQMANELKTSQSCISMMLKGTRDNTRLALAISERCGMPLKDLIVNNPNSIIIPNSVDETPKLGYLSVDMPSEVVPSIRSELKEYTTTKNGMKYYVTNEGNLYMRAPLVSQSVLGSLPDEWEGEQPYEDDKYGLFPVDAVHHGRYLAFRVTGDSMNDGSRNSFESGDIVLVRELPKDEWAPRLHINHWSFWVVAFGNNVRIKQIISQDEEKGTITLHSLNPSPEYTDFTISLSEVSRLFNVVQHIPHPVKF